MTGALMSDIVQTVGQYFVIAVVSRAIPPPPHAINRGVAVQGLAAVVSGVVGTGHSTLPFGQNIGAIVITKVSTTP